MALAAEHLTAAPAGLAASISSTAVASASVGTGSIFTLLKSMAVTKLETGIVTAILIASVMTPLLLQHRAQASLREQDEAARQQSSQIASLGEDNKHLAAQWDQPTASRSAADAQLRELLRLRSEVGRLKHTVQDLTHSKPPAPLSPEDQLASLTKLYAAQVDRLKQWLDANPSEKIPELQHISNSAWLDAVANLGRNEDDLAAAASTLRDNAQLQVFDVLWGALRQYAKANDGQFPASMSQLTPFFRSPIDDAILQRYDIVAKRNMVLSGSNRFDIIYQGSLDKLDGIPLGTVAVIRDQQTWPSPSGKMLRAYGMADGHGQIVSADDNFQSWESQHVILPPRPGQ